jgi:hypothetical protein
MLTKSREYYMRQPQDQVLLSHKRKKPKKYQSNALAAVNEENRRFSTVKTRAQNRPAFGRSVDQLTRQGFNANWPPMWLTNGSI